ncbi:ras-related and estrogen-regulated growth inhibitor-like isoform X2 [Phymastichus coffea]|uniref:ras-related and estrogen-regulated growth inhibitor-like isoform X2 n=1 Tax=Phymastichus coffea TaxID=108790 RepID=UPI00273AFA91|nr:ras-related and estrogen-regulated growth inhibitor-like isoform X2 [Phymastichus coffea]
MLLLNRAIAVRFATRRYIGEYDCTVERLYRVDGPSVTSWELVDPPGDPTQPPSESKLRWADAVLLVYSVTDRVSFDETWRLRFLLNQARKASKKLPHPVVLLVGNKTDLAGPPDGDRMVSTAEGQRRAIDIEAQAFHEISARESLEQVTSVFVSVARLVLVAQSGDERHVAGALPFRLRASTDGSIDARRRPSIQQPLSKRRLSISVRGAPH